MPALEGQVIVRSTNVSSTSMGTTEIDELVKKLSETLRLKAKQKQRAHRASPYHSPCKHCRTGQVCHSKDCSYLRHTHSKRIKKKTGDNDAHKLLEQLLRQGNLIKEAVGRLNFKSEPKCKYSSQWSYSSDFDDDACLDVCEPPSPAC
ncbi:GSK-3 binding protein FRAT1 [Saccoglossus kowalevskii]|uniref:GSK-3 binding protein FRAT1 n=1 Tax=Saccoglossus kowalevskii TaxID=10224 RepID=B5THN9_SACKO|nr:GSK-3 binding protein FRAT1 [Saccoglossus kowalevskii]ACH73247.1 gsk3-binding protein [Saccoglossus kowalevskii]